MKFFDKEKELLITDVDGVLLDLMAGFDKNLPNTAKEIGLDPKPAHQFIRNMRLGKKPVSSNLGDTMKHLWPKLNDIEIQKLKKTFLKKREGVSEDHIFDTLFDVAQIIKP